MNPPEQVWLGWVPKETTTNSIKLRFDESSRASLTGSLYKDSAQY
jgi:hypothetical protein